MSDIQYARVAKHDRPQMVYDVDPGATTWIALAHDFASMPIGLWRGRSPSDRPYDDQKRSRTPVVIVS